MMMTRVFSSVSFAIVLITIIIPTRPSSATPDVRRQHRLLSKIHPNDIHTRIHQEISRKLGPVTDECWTEFYAFQEDPAVSMSLPDFTNTTFLENICNVDSTDDDGIFFTCDLSLLTDIESACESVGGQHVLFDLTISLDSTSFVTDDDDASFVYDDDFTFTWDDDFYNFTDDDGFYFLDDDDSVFAYNITLQYKNIGICIGASCNAADFSYAFDQVYELLVGPNVEFINLDNSTRTPTLSPAPSVSSMPSLGPTVSLAPTRKPTMRHTASPTSSPTTIPSSRPTTYGVVPSANPTISVEPSQKPTAKPTSIPTASPTALPTVSSTNVPSSVPTFSSEPSVNPSISVAPSQKPTAKPTSLTTAVPTVSSTIVPTVDFSPECLMSLFTFSEDDIISPFAVIMNLATYQNKCVVSSSEASITCDVANFDNWNAEVNDVCEGNDGTYSEMTVVAIFADASLETDVNLELNNAGICIPNSCDGEEVTEILEYFLELSNPAEIVSVDVILEDAPDSLTSSSFQASVTWTVCSFSFLIGMYLLI